MAGPVGVTAIYVDTTDRVEPVSRADVLGKLEDLVSATEPDEMVAAYRSSSVGSAVSPFDPLLTRCHPGDPETASQLTQNPRLIRRRLAEQFRGPLDRVFRETLDASEADASPLMENIQAISVTLLSRGRFEAVPKRLVLVSDLMQHSEHLSVYRGVPDYVAFARTGSAAAVSSDLREVRVEVLFVQRRQHEDIGGAMELIEFWTKWIEDQGGQLDRITRISGLNAS
ncbi:MAG: hypothetical protein OXE58_04680 [Acidobacteria bacterium]|nr:hypothetical protein [Acidobacteriota bacterium]